VRAGVPPLVKSQDERYGDREDYQDYRRKTPKILPAPFLKPIEKCW